MVKNAERAVQRNTQVIKRLELRITRELQDAIGRFHTTTSSISLDSICTQDEIERLLTDCGSALSLTLSDVSDDAASIIFMPDTLSGVDSSSVRIKFPTVENEALNVTEETSFAQPATKFNFEAGGSVKAGLRNPTRIDLYLNLAETLDLGLKPRFDGKAVKQGQGRELKKHDSVPISAPSVQDNEGLSIARNITDAIETNRLTAVRKAKKAEGGSPGLQFELVGSVVSRVLVSQFIVFS